MTYPKHATCPEENYIPAQRVANNPSMKASVMDRAHADMDAFIRRYERYAEFMEVFSPVIKAYHEMMRRKEAA